MKYKFKYKKSGKLFWKSRTVVGHGYDKEQDKMCLFSEDGSLEEICEWKKHSVKLGTDWVLATKKQMEKETGTNIPMNIGG